jgi:hypothetical protein
VSALDALLFGYRKIFGNGAELPNRNAVDFIGGTVSDNPTSGRTEIILPSGGDIAFATSTERLLIAGEMTTTSTTPTRKGSRTIRFADFPASIGNLVREVRYVASLDVSATPAIATVDVWTKEGDIQVAGTQLDNAAAAFPTQPTEFESAPLTLGVTPGMLRTDIAATYIARIWRVDGTISNGITCTNGRFSIRYVAP